MVSPALVSSTSTPSPLPLGDDWSVPLGPRVQTPHSARGGPGPHPCLATAPSVSAISGTQFRSLPLDTRLPPAPPTAIAAIFSLAQSTPRFPEASSQSQSRKKAPEGGTFHLNNQSVSHGSRAGGGRVGSGSSRQSAGFTVTYGEASEQSPISGSDSRRT